MERQELRENPPFLSFDLLCEVLNRVDAVTLAKASCVSSSFRLASAREQVWQRLCNAQWPATKQLVAQELILQTGGYRKFISRCHPCLSGKGTTITSTSTSANREPPLNAANSSSSTSKEEDPGEPSPSHFVSIVDIKYKDEPLLSRLVAGFPGVEEFEWFESCPFQFELLEVPDEEDGVRKDEDGVTSIFIDTHLEWVSCVEERKVGRIWNALNAHMTASWILVNKMTGEMANLASSKPVGGRRQWPCEDEFVLHFGTIVSAGLGLPSDVIHCNVSLKARYFSTQKTAISITELGMKLENLDGARLYGKESVALLGRALSSNRTISHSTVTESYNEFHGKQLLRKEEKIQQENQREMIAALVSGFGAFLCLCYLLL